MPGKRIKRKLLENEDYSDSDSDFEIEVKRVSKESSRKKKKIYTSSDNSDEEPLNILKNKPLRNLKSCKSLESDSESAENKLNVSSDEDKPLINVAKASNGNGKSNVKHNVSSCSDVDDEPLAKKEKNRSSESEENELDESSEDEPIIKIAKASKLDCKSDDMKSSSVSSDEDKPLVEKRKKNAELSINKLSKNQKAESEENGLDESSEDEPIIKIAKASKLNCKSDNMKSSSVSSDEDETLVEKRKKNAELSINKTSKNQKAESEGNDLDTSFEEETIVKSVKSSKMNNKSNDSDVSSNVSDDDDEPLVKKCKSDSKFEKNGLSAFSEDESVIKTAKTKEINRRSIESDVSSNVSDEDGHSLNKSEKDSDSEENGVSVFSEKQHLVKRSQASKALSSSEDDEPLAKKREKLSKTNRKKGKSSNSEENGFDLSSEKKTSIKNGKSNKISSDESSDDEPLASKKYVKQKSEKQRNSSGSSDGDEHKSTSAISSDKKNDKKVKTNDKIEHLKKYLRLSGIHINSYDKLFADCKSIKAKTEKLLSILHEKGLKGRPTVEKCKKLKKKIETKKEIAELDTSNIIKTEGRPKRGSTVMQKQIVKSSPINKRFSRLKDIVDSEESD